MNEQRSARLQAALMEEISDIIHNEMKDPRIGFASLTEVELSPDYRQAKVFVSVLGDEGQKESTLAGLNSAVGFIRTEVGRRVRLRFTPEIIFKLDNSIERGSRIFELLQKVEKEGKGEGHNG